MIKEYKKYSKVALSKDFFLSEFDCHCSYHDCEFTYVDEDLIQYLQNKRDTLRRGIVINSGYRCSRHNKDQGGKPGSQHLVGKAADIRIIGLTPREMAAIFDDADGLGLYSTFVHVDVRGHRSRWRG